MHQKGIPDAQAKERHNCRDCQHADHDDHPELGSAVAVCVRRWIGWLALLYVKVRAERIAMGIALCRVIACVQLVTPWVAVQRIEAWVKRIAQWVTVGEQ